MRKIFIFGFLSFSIWNTSAQTYTVPGAQIQPSWVFPLWFENGNGQRDTIYYCYDPSSSIWNPDHDTILGEVPQVLDTSKFQTYLGCFIDSSLLIGKAIIIDSLELVSSQLNGIDICFWKAHLPITLRWDPLLFYSDTLPFPDLDPAPKVQGKLAFDFPMGVFNCSYQYPIYMTDTTLGPDAYVPACVFTDSILFEGSGASYLYFHIEPWTGKFLSVNNLENEPLIDVSFEIASDKLTIRNDTKQEAHAYLIYSIVLADIQCDLAA